MRGKVCLVFTFEPFTHELLFFWKYFSSREREREWIRERKREGEWIRERERERK